MKLKKFLLVVSLNLQLTLLLGQIGDSNHALKFKNISTKHGLSQSSVLCIIQDSRGFLWFGTRDGLNKYDGNIIKVYSHNSESTTSLSHNFIRSLVEDSHGTLWVGTKQGLNRYDQRKDSFRKVVQSHDKNNKLSGEIWDLVVDDKDHLLVATNNSLYKLDVYSEQIENIFSIEEDGNNLNKNSIRSIFKTNNGGIWIKTDRGIYFRGFGREEFKRYASPINSSKGGSQLSTLYEDKKKNIWLGSKDGLEQFNNKSNKFEVFKLGSIPNPPIKGEVRSICEDYNGNLWVGTYNGLYIINAIKDAVSYFIHDENNSSSLSQNSIYKIYEDNKGDIWLGTYAGGVNQYDRSYDAFKHYESGVNDTKLNNKVVSSIVEDANQNLWVGTEGGGINFYDKKKGEYKYYKNSLNDPKSISVDNIKTLMIDHNANLWIGTHKGGLNFLKTKEYPYIFKKFNNIPDEINSLSSNIVISLLEDYDQNIWIGTAKGGLNVLNPITKSVVRVKDIENHLGADIYAIYKTFSKDSLLIAGNKGIAKIDVQSKKLNPIDYNGNKGYPVLCAYNDQSNNLWIGTEGDGLYCYNYKSSIKYSVSEGLPSNTIYGILPDDNNNIWLSTNHGLSRLNLKSREFKNFDESDGLQGNEFNYGAHLKNQEGELIFGGVNGFNVFDPNKIIENKYIPQVSLTSIKVNNKPLSNVINNGEKLSLRHHENVIQFDFIALSYSQPNKNQYAYMLEGFDDDWNYIGNKKSATYTNLDAGNYVFKVKASNNDNFWNEQGTSLSLSIYPAPWLTWWAYLLYSFFIISTALLVIKYASVRIREKIELKNERLEKERIEKVNKLKLQLFTNISHDFRTPLTLIIGPLEQLLKIKSKDSFVQKQHETMYRNASVLMRLVNQLLDFRKSEAGKLSLHASQNNIVHFIEEVKLAFEGLSKVKKIELILISNSKNIQLWFDTIKLEMVLFNLLSNAFKFSHENSKIKIQISICKNDKNLISNQFVKIKIKNKGKEIPKENIKFIFDMFYQLKGRFGSGIGLTLSKRIVELHQGVINVQSTKEKGTCFTILLPMGNAHLNKNQILEPEEKTNENSHFNFDKTVFIDGDLKSLEAEEQMTESSFNESLPTILLVEDNFEVRLFIKQIFQKGYNIFDASHGQEAIVIAKTKPIDLIISDVMMPVMDGIELCNNIKSNIITSHIPVILLTARTSMEYQKLGYKKGADAYITKPFDSDILETRVVNVLKTRKNLIDKFKKDLILKPKELTITSTDEIFLQKALDIIEKNISNSEFTPIAFISEMGMSRSALYRKLKALTGQSITEFVRTIKLKRAAQLMQQTEMTISNIAFELGFMDQKHFRQSFKALFNVLPSKYKKERKSEN